MSFFEVFELIVVSFFLARLMVLSSVLPDLFRAAELGSRAEALPDTGTITAAELATLKAKALA